MDESILADLLLTFTIGLALGWAGESIWLDWRKRR